MKLLDTISSNTVGASFVNQRLERGHGECMFSFYAWGTLGGGTIILWVSPDNVNWFKARDINGAQVTLTVPDVLSVYIRAGNFRAELTGAIGASGVNAMLI